MFTGIVEELGEITGWEELPDAARITVRGPLVTSDAKHGDSIAVNGVCLTVVTHEDGAFTADVMHETLTRSSLRLGSKVNLERAVRLQDRLGGHLVQGHVDGTGEILSREPSEHWERVTISLPFELNRYLVDKGSITVDGISLTVAEVGAASFVGTSVFAFTGVLLHDGTLPVDQMLRIIVTSVLWDLLLAPLLVPVLLWLFGTMRPPRDRLVDQPLRVGS